MNEKLEGGGLAPMPVSLNTWHPMSAFDPKSRDAWESRRIVFWIRASTVAENMADMVNDGWVDGERAMGAWRHMGTEADPLDALHALEPTHFMIVSEPV